VLQALLRRLEKRLSAAGVTSDGAQSLLRQLSPSAPAGRKLERYPVRVMLCAYMIKEHPEVVFNSVVSKHGHMRALCAGVLRYNRHTEPSTHVSVGRGHTCMP
jgi:hypothetical protein